MPLFARFALSLQCKYINMIRLVLISLVFIAIGMVLLSVTVLVKKNGRFPNTHIGSDKNMRKRGIGCAQAQHRQAQRPNKLAVEEHSHHDE